MTDTAEHLGGIDLVWKGIGQDSWEMIEQGANELVTLGDQFNVGARLLEVVSNENRTWLDAEQLVTEFYKNSTSKLMTDQEVMERAQSIEIAKNLGETTTAGTIWNEDTQKWD